MRPIPLVLLLSCSTAGAGPAPEPVHYASDAFWEAWGDGKAELAGYRLTTPRYGQARSGTVVLITVTEPHDDRTWTKDDSLQGAHRVDVLKLNHVEHFQTGIYDYELMTSVFSPVHGPAERFSPARVRFSAQEWCGHTYSDWVIGQGVLEETLHSYFAGEGDQRRTLSTADEVLYEDALYVQLRELDGPFAGGADWQGWLVPRAWYARRDHVTPTAVRATIAREPREGGTRFTLEAAGRTKTFDIAADHTLLGWTSSDGEQAELLGRTRLPYWQLSGEGAERALAELGMTASTFPSPQTRDSP